MKKLIIATPAFNKQISTDYFDCIMNTIPATFARGWQVEILTNHRDGLVSLARNAAANAALARGVDKILFIDSDIVWKPQHVSKLLESDKLIVGGNYPYKKFPIQMVMFDGPQTKDIEREVEAIPTGFLLVDVSVFDTLRASAKLYTRYGTGEEPREEHDFFRVGVRNGRYETEDVGFCSLARENGFKIYYHSECKVGHTGVHTYNLG